MLQHLGLDKYFYELLDKHFENDLVKVDKYIEGIIEKHNGIEKFDYLYASLTNVVKAAHFSGNSWRSILEYVDTKLDIPVDGKEAEKLIVAVSCKFLDAVGQLELKKEKECCAMGGTSNGRDRTALGYTVDEAPVKSWDEYFYNVAKQAARNSKCFSRRIGAILVKDNSIISTGYNGPPRGIPTCDKRWKIDSDFIAKYGNCIPEDTVVAGKCPRYVLGAKSGEKMHLCVAGHAEENAILNCARLGISTKDTVMYMTCGIPCSKCWVKIINAGVKELVVTAHTIYDESTRFLLDNSGVKVRLFDFLL